MWHSYLNIQNFKDLDSKKILLLNGEIKTIEPINSPASPPWHSICKI